MQQIQVSRGLLSVRRTQSELLNGELFVDYKRGEKYDSTDASSYELYVGVDGSPVKVGGQGVLSFIRQIDDDKLPTNPVEGGIYYVTKEIQLETGKNSSGKDLAEFRPGDLAIYVGSSIGDKDNPIYRFDGVFEAAPGWIRINNGGGFAYETVFDNTFTNLKSENVQEAIVELDRNKLAYGGVKFDVNATAGTDQIATEQAGDTVLKLSEIFPKLKAGYYYSVGTLAKNTNLTIILNADGDGSGSGEGTKTLVLEEGDFLAVTSNVTTNSTPLTAADVTLTKIAGGTHDSARINYEAGTRADTYNASGDKAWDEKDAAVGNVKDALDDLFLTKADLTAKGKIPLTQLPDTLLGSMEYQGTFGSSVKREVNGDGEVTISTFELPTNANIIQPRDDEDTEKELVKGDYWIYTGEQVKVTSIPNLETAEGYLNTGDWIVYNGKDANGNDLWATVDNTSPITSISLLDNYHTDDDADESTAHVDNLSQETVQGNIQFEGTNRVRSTDNEKINEVGLSTDHDHTIQIHAENAALIKDDEIAGIGGIYKEAGSKTLKKTGLSENDNVFTIDEADGIKVTGGVFDKDDGETKLHVTIKQNERQSTITNDNIDLKLPQASGTIARLEDIGLTSGNAFYLPRYREDDEGVSLVPSPIEIRDHSSEPNTDELIGITFHGHVDGDTGLAFDTDVVLQSNGDKNDVVHVMPKYSGFILNSNSIIDCGEWTEKGVKFANEGVINTFYGDQGKTTISSIIGAAYTGIIRKGIADTTPPAGE